MDLESLPPNSYQTYGLVLFSFLDRHDCSDIMIYPVVAFAATATSAIFVASGVCNLLQSHFPELDD